MRSKVALPLLLILYLFLNLYCLFNESPTWDEPLQLTVGQMLWQTKEFILEPVEPPFARLITSLPVVLFGQKLMTGRLGQVFFYPRLVVILVGCLFLFFFYQVLKKLFNENLAILGTVLFIFEPNLLTHSHYNTTDFIFTVLFFVVIYLFFERLRLPSIFLSTRSRGGREVLLLSSRFATLTRTIKFYSLPIFLALLFVTKTSGPIIFFFTAFLIMSLRGRGASRPWQSLARVLRLQFTPSKTEGLTMTLFIFFLTFWSCYLFKTGPAISSKTAEVGKPHLFYVFENKPFWLKIFKTPLPFIDYLATLKYAVSYQKAGFDSYFAGKYSRFGWWWYFPVVFLLKTPLPLLILFLIGISFSLIKCHPEFISGTSQKSGKMLKPFFYQGKQVQHDILIYLVPIISIFILSLFVRINIGLRHILPIYPLIIIIALFGAENLLNKEKTRRIILGGLVIWYILRTIYFLPHPITFTNEFLPPGKSYQVLADSNISWGQELLEIRKWQLKLRTKNLEQRTINIFYFGNVKVENYLTDFKQWGCEDYKNFQRLLKEKKTPILVSATCLQKMAAHDNKKILEIKPRGIITRSVLVY